MMAQRTCIGDREESVLAAPRPHSSDIDRALDGGEPQLRGRDAVMDIAPEPEPGQGADAPAADAPPPAAPPLPAPAIALDHLVEDAPDAQTKTPAKTRTIGIVIVHGIGSQLPDQTLIEWAKPLIQAISAWQEVNHDDLVGALARTVMPDDTPAAHAPAATPQPPPAAAPQPLDPVINAQMDFEGSTLPVVTLNIPGLRSKAGTPAGERQVWLLTEAWWASRVAPPSFATMVDWCGRQGIVSRVVQSIVREDPRTGRRGQLARASSRLGVGLFLSVMTTLALFAFGILRTIAALVPIDAVKNATIFAQFDTFLTTWWGDTYVLLRDPVEAANIRGRLAEAIIGLRKLEVDAIVVIAHSGGTIVSYTTLSDPGLADPNKKLPDVRADLLITHAEAINLARLLTGNVRKSMGPTKEADRVAAVDAIPTADRTSRDGIRATRWVDFWASRDPAPNGDLDEVVNPPTPPDATHPRVESHPIWNRMSLSEDHGTYWDNDEEFVLPVLRELDLAGDPGAKGPSRFATYRGGGNAADWQLRHRQRVWILAFWRRLTFIIPFAAILLAILPEGGFFVAVATAARWLWTTIGLDKVWDPVAKFVGGTQVQPLAHVQFAFLTIAMTSFGAALVALVVHSMGGIGKHEETFATPTGRRGAWAAELVASTLAPLALVLLAIVGRGAAFATDVPCFDFSTVQVGPISAPQNLCVTPYFLGLVLGVIVAAVVFVALYVVSTNAHSGDPDPQHATVAFVLTVTGIVVVAAIGLSFMTDELTRIWIVGVVAAVLLFRRIDSFGATRWARWDESERMLARRQDPNPPNRLWPAGQALTILLSSIAVGMGIAVAPGTFLGVPGWNLFGLGIAALLVGALVMTVVDGASAESSSS
jgi:hypothetical protein